MLHAKLVSPWKGKQNAESQQSIHCVIKNQRDQQQVAVLARQMYPHNTQHFMKALNNAAQKPFGHVVSDLKQDTLNQYRLRSNVIKHHFMPKSLMDAKPKHM